MKFTDSKFGEKFEESKYYETKYNVEPKFEPKCSETIIFDPVIEPKFTESYCEKYTTESNLSDNLIQETKFSSSPSFVLHKISLKKVFDKFDSNFEARELKRNKSEDKEDVPEEKYPRFDDNISSSFIPPFNNPVYPNSTQFTGFTSVIGKIMFNL